MAREINAKIDALFVEGPDPGDDRKATLEVRSVWRDARAAGGYGHLARNLPLVETPASVAFLAWFGQLYLT